MATAPLLLAAGTVCGGGVIQACKVWDEFRKIPNDVARLERLCMACRVGCTCGKCKVEIGAADQGTMMAKRNGHATIARETDACIKEMSDPEPLIVARAKRIMELLGDEHEVEIGPTEVDAPGNAQRCSFSTDENGRILEIDAAMAEIVNMNVQTMRESGYGWAAKLHSDDFRRVVALWITCTKEKWTFATRYRFVHPYRSVHCFTIVNPVMQDDTCVGFEGHIWPVEEAVYDRLDL